MWRIAVIAMNTFRESVRSRIRPGLLVFVPLLVAASLALARMAVGSESRTVVDLGLSSMSLFGTVLAIYLSIGLVSNEIERRTIDVVLSRPVRRSQFLAGKYLGLLMVLAAVCLITTAAVDLALLGVQGGFDLLQLRIWPAAWLILIELAIMTAVALFFSSFASQAVSALLSLLVFLIGRWGADLELMVRTAGSVRAIGRIVYHILPNLSYFNLIGNVARGGSVAGSDLLWPTLYGAGYVIAVLAATVFIFNRRDFK